MAWLWWEAGAGDQYVVINAEIERLKALLSNESSLRIEETQRLQKELLFEINANEEKGRRIEELEKDRRISDGLPHPWYGPCDGFGPDGTCVECREVREHCLEHNYYPITDEQIDKAWEEAHRDPIRVWDVFDLLGIVRCPDVPDGCGGTGMTLGDTCPDCNGKGWVIKVC